MSHLALPTLAALLLALLVFARRGRRVDDHPLCRACGYDLSGSPAPLLRCSECGRDLTRRRALRTGNRTPRRRLTWVVAPVFLLALAGTGLDAYVSLRGVDTIRYQPTWWLLRKARIADAAGAPPAVNELIRRYTANELSAANADALITVLMDLQADPAGPWSLSWSRFMEARCTVDPTLRDRYWPVLLDLLLQARHNTSVPTPNPVLVVGVLPQANRCALGGRFSAAWHAARLTIDGADIDPRLLEGLYGGLGYGGGTLVESVIPLVAAPAAPPRPVALEATVVVTVIPSPAIPPGTARRTIRHTFTLPAGYVPVTFGREPLPEPIVRRAITARIEPAGTTKPGGSGLRLVLACDAAPADLAYRVQFATPHTFWGLPLTGPGEPVLVCRRGAAARLEVDVSPGVAVDPADVLLASDPFAAARAGMPVICGRALRLTVNASKP